MTINRSLSNMDTRRGLLALVCTVVLFVAIAWTAISVPPGLARIGMIVGLVSALGASCWWWMSRETILEGARTWAQVFQLVGILLAGFVAYETFLTPFSPAIVADTLNYRMGPNTYDGNLEVIVWASISNAGALNGELSNLALKVLFPKGNCVLQPIFFVSSVEYLHLMLKGSESPPFEAPFSQIFLPGHSQVSRAILFSPIGWDPTLVEPGVYRAMLITRLKDGTTKEAAALRLSISAEDVENWKAGKTVARLILTQDVSWYESLRK